MCNVLASAKLHKSDSISKNNRKFKYMLKSSVPNIEPCGTPCNISAQVLKELFIFCLAINSSWLRVSNAVGR